MRETRPMRRHAYQHRHQIEFPGKFRYQHFHVCQSLEMSDHQIRGQL